MTKDDDVCPARGFIGNDGRCDDHGALATFGLDEFKLLCRWTSGTVSTRHRNAEEGAMPPAATEAPRDPTASRDPDRNDDDDQPEHSQTKTAEDYYDDDSSTNIAKVVSALKLECGVNGLGRACQRLIDYGRREYIAHCLVDASDCGAGDATARRKNHVELIYYVPPDVTPQNAALVAAF